MAGGKKNKSSSNQKKNKSRRNKNDGAGNNKNRDKVEKNPISLEEVLTRAESAMEMSDTDGALTLLAYAKEVLSSRVNAPVTGTDGSDGNCNVMHGIDMDNDRDKETLSTVLGKMGELKASNGDRDGARTDFLDAIEMMGPSQANGEESRGGHYLSIAQNCEKRAGLHLYLGQLSSGTEALNSFRVGVCELERAVGILEGNCAAAATMDLESCEEKMTEPDKLQQYLIEMR